MGTKGVAVVNRPKKAKPRGATIGICPRCRRGETRRQEGCTLCGGVGSVWVSKD